MESWQGTPQVVQHWVCASICCYYICRQCTLPVIVLLLRYHMLTVAELGSLLCEWQHKTWSTCMCFLSVSEACSARSKSFTRSLRARRSLSPLLTASSCCWSKIWVVVRRSSSPRFPIMRHPNNTACSRLSDLILTPLRNGFWAACLHCADEGYFRVWHKQTAKSFPELI